MQLRRFPAIINADKFLPENSYAPSLEISTKSYYLKEYLKDLVDCVDTDALDDTDERLDNTDEGPSDRIFVVDLLQFRSFD